MRHAHTPWWLGEVAPRPARSSQQSPACARATAIQKRPLLVMCSEFSLGGPYGGVKAPTRQTPICLHMSQKNLAEHQGRVLRGRRSTKLFRMVGLVG